MQLIISQVHYNSEHQFPQNAAEFIEVMNISTQPVNLKNWELDDISHSQQSYRVLHDFWLQPDQRAVFANDWDGLYTQHYRYGYDFDLNDNTGQGQNAQGQNILRIRLADNGDDAIALRRPDGSIEDVMSWRGTTYGGYTWNLTQNGDKTMSLHRQQVNCSTGCSKPADWAVVPRAPYAADYYYDANGNRIIDKDSGLSMMNDARGMHFTYDERNLPTRIGNARYRYNAEGHRYYSEVAGVHTVTIMDGDRNVGSFRSTNGISWQMSYWNIHGNGLEGRYDNPNVTYHKRFYHKDHLGSTRVVVDQSGTVIGSYDYFPFGLEMPGRSSTTGLATRQKFTGHQRDEEVGLDYMVWRRYNPAFPVFLSVDPMYALYPGWSPYNYVLGNPLSLIDPWGLAPCEAGTEALEDGMPCYQSETITVTAMPEGGIFVSSLMFPPKNRGLSFQDYTDEHGRNVTRISADASTPKGAGAMYGHWRSNSSEACNVASGGGNFSAQARSIATRACMHAGQVRTIRNSADLLSSSLTYVGAGASAAGWVLSPVPGLGAGLLVIGGGMSTAGGFIGAGVSLYDGYTSHGSFTGITTITSIAVDVGFRRLSLNSQLQQNIMIGANHFLHNGINVPLQSTGYKVGH